MLSKTAFMKYEVMMEPTASVYQYLGDSNPTDRVHIGERIRLCFPSGSNPEMKGMRLTQKPQLHCSRGYAYDFAALSR